MHTSFNFSDEENWIGGYYEAAIVLGSTHSQHADSILLEAIKHLWAT